MALQAAVEQRSGQLFAAQPGARGAGARRCRLPSLPAICAIADAELVVSRHRSAERAPRGARRASAPRSCAPQAIYDAGGRPVRALLARRDPQRAHHPASRRRLSSRRRLQPARRRRGRDAVGLRAARHRLCAGLSRRCRRGDRLPIRRSPHDDQPRKPSWRNGRADRRHHRRRAGAARGLGRDALSISRIAGSAIGSNRPSEGSGPVQAWRGSSRTGVGHGDLR